ncbi:MAG TPA: polysaccharide deacetylase family protein [Gaiellaceae bacterium]
MNERLERRARERRARRRRRIVTVTLVVGAVAAGTVAVLRAPHARHAAAVAVRRHAPRVVHVHARVRFRPTRAYLTARVPILMYHVIAAPPPGAPFPGLYVPAQEFAAQMDALARAGFHGVTQNAVLRAWRGSGPLPRNPIVVTFDNGYRTQYTAALPVLRRLHWPAVENLQLAGLPPRQGGILPREVRALLGAGWELDTQGMSHADLPELDARALARQIVVARNVIERRYHVRPRWFCYPSGRYDGTVIAAVRAAGFVGSTTVWPGWAAPTDDPYRLPRLRVLGGTSPPALLAQIRAARFALPAPASY